MNQPQFPQGLFSHIDDTVTFGTDDDLSTAGGAPYRSSLFDERLLITLIGRKQVLLE